MAWSEIDLAKRTWTLPSERSKNHRALELPLPDLAVDVLKNIRRDGDLLFGLTGTDWARCKRHLDKLTDLEAWSWHDLRRSAVTHMIEQLDAAPHVVEAIVNHVGHKRGVAGIYNKSRYREPMRRTIDAWAAYLDRIVTGRSAEVVALRR
jgi:integrase